VKTIRADFSNRDDDVMTHVSHLLDRVGRDLRVPPDVVTDLRIALDEIVTNIVNYAYTDNARHDISIHCEVREGRLETTIEDDGIAFDPLAAPEPDLDSPLATRRVGGLGVHFVKNLVNSIAYERVDGRNRLTLKQQTAPHGDAA
jgi:anti-sigma regulatory factor (Ser/Thr protein kinase)